MTKISAWSSSSIGGQPDSPCSPRFADVHAHLADPRIVSQAPRLLRDARDAGIAHVVIAAAARGDWDDVLRLAQHPGALAALGIHPFHWRQWEEAATHLRALLADGLAVAVGEIGLDFTGGREDRGGQIRVLAEQLELAAEFDVPVLRQNRKSWGEFFGVLRDLDLTGLRGVCHHFTGSREVLEQVLDRGLDVAFCGPLTYPNARRIHAAARYAPSGRILTETDTPDLPVAAHKGGHSEPAHVGKIVAALAALRGVEMPTMAAEILGTFQRLFRPGNQREGS